MRSGCARVTAVLCSGSGLRQQVTWRSLAVLLMRGIRVQAACGLQACACFVRAVCRSCIDAVTIPFRLRL